MKIENRLIGKVVLMALDTLKEAWAPIHPIDFVYVRSEFNPLAVAICPPTDVVIIVTIEVELEQDSATITRCIPYSTIEPLRGKLATGFQSTRLEMDGAHKQRMEQSLMETRANVSVELARGAITTKELTNLNVGDVMMLETNPADEAIVKIEDQAKFYGYIGNYQGSRAVRLSREIPDDDLLRMRTLKDE